MKRKDTQPVMDSGSSVSVETYTLVCLLFGGIAGILSGGLVIALCIIWKLRLRLARYEGKGHQGIPRKVLRKAISQEYSLTERAVDDILSSLKRLDTRPPRDHQP